MMLSIIEYKPVDPQVFIVFWSRRYSYRSEDYEQLYCDNIGKELTVERVWQLYKWKNGSNIARKKRQSVESVYLSELGKLPKLSTIEEGRIYLEKLSGGAIWGIFWLHCINPKIFPIFDQNTYRSMAAILGLKPTEIPPKNRDKIKAYFDQYLLFLSKFGSVEGRALDQALFAYGRFLKLSLSPDNSN